MTEAVSSSQHSPLETQSPTGFCHALLMSGRGA